jgi:hypothetical protein
LGCQCGPRFGLNSLSDEEQKPWGVFPFSIIRSFLDLKK